MDIILKDGMARAQGLEYYARSKHMSISHACTAPDTIASDVVYDSVGNIVIHLLQMVSHRILLHTSLNDRKHLSELEVICSGPSVNAKRLMELEVMLDRCSNGIPSL